MSDARIGDLWAVLQQPQLPVPAHVMRAKARLMQTLVEQLTPVVTAVAQYRKAIDDFSSRAAPTLWARLGDAPGRWESFRHLQAQAGAAVPVTKRSGNQRIVHFPLRL